jgi:hypothetical protein
MTMGSDHETTVEEVEYAASVGSVWRLNLYLKNADPRIRRHAAGKLQELMDPRAVDGLISALGDTDAGIASIAAATLGSLRDPRAVEPLRAAANHAPEEVRVAATKALADIGQSPRSPKELRQARKLAKKARKRGKKHLTEDVAADVARMTHATVRFQPPRPGFTGTVHLPDVCAWCGERAPSDTVHREVHQDKVHWKDGIVEKSLTVDLGWTVTIPYCAECWPRAQTPQPAYGQMDQPCDAVYWGQCQVAYAGEIVGDVRVPAWVEFLELVFLNADVAQRLDAQYRNLEVRTWTGGLFRSAWRLSGLQPEKNYHGYSRFPNENGQAQVMVRKA